MDSKICGGRAAGAAVKDAPGKKRSGLECPRLDHLPDDTPAEVLLEHIACTRLRNVIRDAIANRTVLSWRSGEGEFISLPTLGDWRRSSARELIWTPGVGRASLDVIKALVSIEPARTLADRREGERLAREQTALEKEARRRERRQRQEERERALFAKLTAKYG